ncbi:hypothetical protein V7R84_12760 [Arachnia propionica]|uniref:hypothetical protein n=1 Tax=Arachnia propionica TaxID=1750 RepID=UPI0030D022C3
MSRMVMCRVGVVAAVISVLVSCSGGSSAPGGGVSGSGSPVSSSPSSEVSSSRPSKSVTPSGPQPSETFTPEQLEAANTVIEYVRISDEVFGNPDGDPQPLKDITTGQSQEIEINVLNDYRRQGHVRTGATVVHITGASEPVEVDGVRTVDVQMCTDVGKTDVIDLATGKSVVISSQRPRYLQWNVTVVKTEEGWKFGDATNDSAPGCPK